MLRAASRGVMRLAGPKASAATMLRRAMSADSHDDFKPKKKEVPTGMEDVIKVSMTLGNDWWR